MTIRELKDFIKDWPETNIDGEPYEVWIGDRSTHLSNEATGVCRLNKNDIIIECN